MIQKYNFAIRALILFTLLTPRLVNAQETNIEVVKIVEIEDLADVNQTVRKHKKVKKDKNLRWSVLGGPGYTPDYGFLIGGSALMTFDMPGMKGSEKRSVVPTAFSITFGDGVYFSATIYPQLFLRGDRLRIYGDFVYSNLENNYYGVGFSHNKATERGVDVTQYFYNKVVINPTVAFRLKDSDWFFGGSFHLQRDEIRDVAQGMVEDKDYIKAGGAPYGFITTNNGLGITLNYDSRDVPANAYSGTYVDFNTMNFGKYYGGESNFTKIQIKYRQYAQLSKVKSGRTLAWSITSDNTFGNAPFTMLSTLGSPFDLRGYYQGQYRDNSAHTAMMEYRHKFHVDPTNFWRKVGNRLGFVTWMGVGMLGPSPFKIEGVLPNYGAGLRIEVQPRMNFRVDVGRSPIEKQTLFYLNMTEAF